MAEASPKALVVDDEPVVRRCVMWALANEGFECEPATDGCAALHKLNEDNFDLVVIDLRMPNKHGYALTMDLMAMQSSSPPMIVIHSAVDDIRLTKHLMAKGVTDVVHKPTDYAQFAAKMKGAILHRRAEHHHHGRSKQSTIDDSLLTLLPTPSEKGESAREDRLSMAEFDMRLECIERIFPVSNSAAELLRCLKENEYDIDTASGIIQQDAALNVEVLRLANVSIGSHARRRIVDINEAIIRLGVQRVVEISLATTTLSGIVSLTSPWIDKPIAKKRSVAAWLAAKRLLEIFPMPAIGSGVMFSSLIYPLRRVVTGAAFPGVYHELVRKVAESDQSLEIGESIAFPRTPAESLAKVLIRLGVPSEMCSPLTLADQSQEQLFLRPDVIKKPAQLVRAAAILGELAVGSWAKWEVKSDLPPSWFFQEIQVDNPYQIIAELRDAMNVGSTT